MWDPRYGAIAADRLADDHARAAADRQLAALPLRPGLVRRHVGLLLIRWGARLASPQAVALPR